jgi:hypothetical protein
MAVSPDLCINELPALKGVLSLSAETTEPSFLRDERFEHRPSVSKPDTRHEIRGNFAAIDTGNSSDDEKRIRGKK